MKKTTKLLLAAAALLTASLGAKAQVPEGYIEIPNYLEKFSDKSVVSSRLNVPTDPFGWDQLKGDIVSGSSTYKIDYSTYSNGKEGYGIGTTTSSWVRKNYSTEEIFNVYDYIITPLVKGDIGFYLRRYSTTSSYVPRIELYKMTKNEDGTFSCDTLANKIESYTPDLKTVLPNTSDWVQQSVNVGDEYCYVGIRMQSVYIDEFSAESAILPIKKDITVGTVSFLDGYSSNISCDEENNVTIGIKIPVTNNSNVVLDAEKEENYTLTVRGLISQSPNTWVDIVTVPLPSLEIGETKNVEVINTFQMPDGCTVMNSSGKTRIRLDIREDFTPSKVEKTGSWIDISTYEAILEIEYRPINSSGNGYSFVYPDSVGVINYGTFKGSDKRWFTLYNRGAKELILNVDKPEYVSFSDYETGAPLEFPLTVPATDKKEVYINIGGEPGCKKGTVDFKFDGKFLKTYKFNVAAEVVAEEEFLADFETDESYNLWYAPELDDSKWKNGEYTSNEYSSTKSVYEIEYNNKKRLQNERNDEPFHNIYSPKLAFEEGDSIKFIAAKRNNNGSTIGLTVSYSTDRSNWVELGKITVTNDDPNLQFSQGTASSSTSGGQNVFKRFAFPMPAGEYYISLGAGYVLVDDFHGGKLVEVPYDIVPVQIEAGKVKTVNNPLTVTASFKNINVSAVPSEDYTVTLYANGEKVATAASTDFLPGAVNEYSFTYTPHAAGETTLYAQLAIGDFTVNSAEIITYIKQESVSNKNVVGTANMNSNYAPFALNWYNSKSEFVYSAEDLASLQGNTINTISFNHYKSKDHTVEHLRVWMTLCDDLNVPTSYSELTPLESMTLVADINEYTFLTAGTSQTVYDKMGETLIELDVPFVYETGKNLRIVVESRDSKSRFGTAYFAFESRTENQTFYYYVDSASSYEGGSGSKGNLKGVPVINIYTEKDLAPVTGTVKTVDGTPIVGATVKAEAGDVYYEAVTTETGDWSMTIFQNELEYTVTASAPGYVTSAPVALNPEGPNDIVLALATWGDFTVTLTADNDDATPLAGLVVALTAEAADAEALEAETDEDGVATFTDLEFGNYTVSVANAGVLFEAYEADEAVAHTAAGDNADVTLTEIVHSPTSHTVGKVDNEDETYDVTVSWVMGTAAETRGEGFYGYTFTVTLNEDAPVTTEETSHTFYGLTAEQDHTVTIAGKSPYGKEGTVYTLTILKSDLDSLRDIEAAQGQWRYFDLKGVEVNSDRIIPGIYIRYNGRSTEKVTVE